MARKKSKSAGGGTPAWMATFADMMTLLMAFFVLLLSLAEIDAEKYRAVAGEMKKALGVKADTTALTVIEGNSKVLIEPTDFKVQCKPAKCEAEEVQADEQIDKLYDLVKSKLSKFAAEHELYVQKTQKQIVIRIQEHGVFPSASDRITAVFLPKVKMLRDVLADLEGGIRVTGHTDDIPIENARFRSNWELSSARAVSVVHELLEDGRIIPERLSAVGYGESRPIVDNVDAESRSRNRRVDIILTPEIDRLVPAGEQTLNDAETHDDVMPASGEASPSPDAGVPPLIAAEPPAGPVTPLVTGPIAPPAAGPVAEPVARPPPEAPAAPATPAVDPSE